MHTTVKLHTFVGFFNHCVLSDEYHIRYYPAFVSARNYDDTLWRLRR